MVSKPVETTYFQLNNAINRPINNQIPLHKDQEALQAYFKEEINPKTRVFDSLREKIEYLIEEDYLEEAFIRQYDFSFIEQLFKQLEAADFRFRSFMGAFKFYQQYAMKSDDRSEYLESYEDRVAFNALYMADGNEQLAERIAKEMINQRYQPATPTFANAGKNAVVSLSHVF